MPSLRIFCATFPGIVWAIIVADILGPHIWLSALPVASLAAFALATSGDGR